jgi:hypothetical protein
MLCVFLMPVLPKFRRRPRFADFKLDLFRQRRDHLPKHWLQAFRNMLPLLAMIAHTGHAIATDRAS